MASDRRLSTGVALLALGLLGTQIASANDTLAQFAAGGLVLTQTKEVEMRSEDLYISEDLVRVTYHFLNTSDADVVGTVAFPMPDIATDGTDFPPSTLTEDPKNLFGFITEVDGRAVKTQVQQVAIKNGVDRSDLLTHMGLPLAPHLILTEERLSHLPAAKLEALEALGLAKDLGPSGPDHPGARFVLPAWTLRSKYYWKQTFPAGREVVIEHRYRPAIGGSVGTRWGEPEWRRDSAFARQRRRYCVDDAFLAAAARTAAPARDGGGSETSEAEIGYVLRTGANWSTPIGRFRLVVDKGRPENLVSFCGQNVRQIGPTLFEMVLRNFTPTSDLNILILDSPKPR